MKRKVWQHKPGYQRHGSTRAWRKLRAAKLKQNPLCERCERQGVDEVATEVHHKDAIADGHPILCPMERLMSVCTACNLALEAERRKGHPPPMESLQGTNRTPVAKLRCFMREIEEGGFMRTDDPT